MRTKTVLIIMIALLVVPAIADAQSWIFRVRGISVQPNDDSDEIGDTGSTVAVGSKSTVEVDITYMFSPRVGLEVIAATTDHDLTASGGALAGADLGTVSVLPPTATLQWYLVPEGSWNLYIGIGINYTLFYDYDLSDALAGLGVTGIDFSNSFGFAGNLGLNLNLGDRWMINGDVKYIQISTDAQINTADGVLDTVPTDINPWVYGIGIGLRF